MIYPTTLKKEREKEIQIYWIILIEQILEQKIIKETPPLPRFDCLQKVNNKWNEWIGIKPEEKR